MMSPGKTSKPQCRSGDELGSIRKPIALRPGLTATVLTCGKDTRIRCIQRLFMPICVSSARKHPFAEGNSSQSADQITARHANGSLNLKTLLRCCSLTARVGEGAPVAAGGGLPRPCGHEKDSSS